MQFTVRGFIPAQGTAGTDQSNLIGRAPRPGTLTVARITPNGTSAFNGTNYRTITIQNRNKTDGTGTTAMAALDTSATALTAFVARNATLNGTPANLVVAAGDMLAAVETHAGTGVAHSGYIVELMFDPVYSVN